MIILLKTIIQVLWLPVYVGKKTISSFLNFFNEKLVLIMRVYAVIIVSAFFLLLGLSVKLFNLNEKLTSLDEKITLLLHDKFQPQRQREVLPRMFNHNRASNRGNIKPFGTRGSRKNN